MAQVAHTAPLCISNGLELSQLFWGVGRFERIGYQGPLPPPGSAHRYVFELVALDAVLDLPPGCTVFDLRAAIRAHALARAELTGLYASAD